MKDGCSLSGCFLFISFAIFALIGGWIVGIGAGIILGIVFIIYIIIKVIEKLIKKWKI